MTEQAKISLDKKYKTRDGKDVVLYTIDPRIQVRPIVGAIKLDENNYIPVTWTIKGYWTYERVISDRDLIEVSEEVITYRAFYYHNEALYLSSGRQTVSNAINQIASELMYKGQVLKTTSIGDMVIKVELLNL